MKNKVHQDILQTLGFGSASSYLDAAFSRNIGLLSFGEQERLAQARVAIPGMGGVGGLHLINMVRTGIGRFSLADFDAFEAANVNRQYGAKVPTFGRPKLEVMTEEALSINPFLDIRTFPEGVKHDSLASFLEGVDVVLDSLDFFQFDIRRDLFNTARSMGIPVITAGPLGFSSALLVFTPEGMGFDDYFDVTEGLLPEEKYLRFAMGLTPRPTQLSYMDLSRVDLQGGKGPSLNNACLLCASLAGTEAVRIILGRPGQKAVPYFMQVDPFRKVMRQGRLARGNRALTQRFKLWYVQNVLLQAAAKARPQVPEKPAWSDFTTLPDNVAKYLLQAAIQAPSGDNVQPWRFRREPDGIRLFLNADADHSFFNVRQAASLIACGAALENMLVAAQGLGLEAQTEWPSAPDDGLALVRAQPGQDVAMPLARQIWTRCTNRRPYSKRPLPQWVQDDVQARIQDIPEAHLHLLTERAQLRTLATLVYRADRLRTERQEMHEHLVSMIRFTPEEAELKRDGFPLKNLEGGVAGDLFLRLTKPWPVMRAVNAVGLGRAVAMHAAQGILASGAAGMVVVNGFENKEILRGGQAMQRIWLALTHHGLQVQPMTAATLFWLRWLWEGAESYSDKHQRLLEKVWTDMRTLFPNVDFERQALVLLFRTGYGPGIRHRTLRKNVESFLE